MVRAANSVFDTRAKAPAVRYPGFSQKPGMTAALAPVVNGKKKQSRWLKNVLTDLNSNVIPTKKFKNEEEAPPEKVSQETDTSSDLAKTEKPEDKKDEPKTDEDAAGKLGDEIADTPLDPQNEPSSCWRRGAELASGTKPNELQSKINETADDRDSGGGGGSGDMMDVMRGNGSQNVREDNADGASVEARLKELKAQGNIPVVVVMKEGHAYAVGMNSAGEMVELDNQNVKVTAADLDNDGVYSMVSGEKKAKDLKAVA